MTLAWEVFYAPPGFTLPTTFLNSLAKTSFLMQICATIVAPTPLLVANSVILGEAIIRLGQQYSRLGATIYTVVFIACDIVALVIQAIGGSIALDEDMSGENLTSGGYIMLGGIVLQLVATSAFMLLAAEFVVRYLRNRPVRARASPFAAHKLEQSMRFMLLVLALSSVSIFARSVYRVIELSDGWDERIISTQRYFDWLNGGMVTLATFTVDIVY
ncbi:uncharacterized protein PHACADRAFT_213499 [Phanerochaete carnosa HHB-10118-sp]|uniref:RTA1 like protein n=1 Tax=Phanerochaete carnosa (strain HHB-10118-sp) TaxID=650164 RepID=K5VH91_PHACS|nr:uncharacterized protein PHACADRAFT_213499 [Phanerochaete carnosa HHB-10118-sp]EKM50598.1 hypothetical protein PHACADRAFT_213499 [Phanerochaete carnosa HHB-10118-sp]